MFGQSGFAGWFGYTAVENVAKSHHASDEKAADAGFISGLAINVAVGALTADAVGLIVGPPVLLARRAGVLGMSGNSADSVASALSTALGAIGKS
jgi:hypothetical protein